MKQTMRSWSAIFSGAFLLVACSHAPKEIPGFTIEGKAQGTTYTIVVAEEEIHFSRAQIDSILLDFDNSLSTYNRDSKLSKLNKSEGTFSFFDQGHYFETVYRMSNVVFKESDGLFDPSVYPLVKAYGFFKKEELLPTPSELDSIRQFVGFEDGKLHTVGFHHDSVFFYKTDKRFCLDFNAIAQGYSADVIADFIEKSGAVNYYIEIGGELRVKGKNREGEDWTIGIDVPNESNTSENREVYTALQISDCGMATSGNYRNFFEKDGKKYGHIVNPKTGQAEITDVLSATVITKNAALADAYATLMMLLGKDKAIAFCEANKDVKVILLYSDATNSEIQMYSSKGLKLIQEF